MHRKDPPQANVHRYYEELCALVAGHEASEGQTMQLQEHMTKCAECSGLLQDLQRYFADPLAQVTVPAGMTDTFMDQLRSTGGVHDVTKPSRTRLRTWMYLVFVICLIGAIPIVRSFQVRRNSSLHGSVRPTASTTSSEPKATPTGNPNAESLLHENAELSGKLRDTRVEVSNLKVQIRDAQNRLQAAEEEHLRLSSEAATAKEELKALKADSDTRIGQLEDELKGLRAERDIYRDAARSRGNELTDLRTRLVAQETRIDEQQRLIATGNLTWELLVGRNTHRMDVYDTDSDGQTSYGRIYYAEGKKLVFIAYDLSETKRLSGDVSFYAWGEKLGVSRPVERLGVFHVENASDRRWILTCDDARVLAQINSVFVTIEPTQNAVTRPHGKRIFSARLDKPSRP